MSRLSQDLREVATFTMRLVAFGASLAIIGAFFLPWVRIDGTSHASSGAELVTLGLSPTINYLWVVSPLQTGILLGCPAILILSALSVVARYGRRKTSPLATCVVFASSSLVLYGVPDLAASNEAGTPIGLLLSIFLSVALLIHQTLIWLCERLRNGRRLHTVYQALAVITGSGYYRWHDSRALWWG